MSTLQFSRSWHIWRGSVLPYRYSFCCGFREHGRCEEETGHLSMRAFINHPDNEAHSQPNTPGASLAWVPSGKTTFSKFVSQCSNGGWSSDLFLITWTVTWSELCNFQLHHNPLVSCRRVAKPHNSSIWLTDMRGNSSACTGLKVEDPINRKTGSTNPVRSAQSVQMNYNSHHGQACTNKQQTHFQLKLQWNIIKGTI